MKEEVAGEVTPEPYVDNGVPLASFRDEVVCICPRCASAAVVRGEWKSALPWPAERARLACRRCAYSKEWSAESWRGPVVGVAHRRCGHCGAWLTAHLQRKRSERLPAMAPIRCEACDQISRLSLTWHPETPSRDAIDPYFGLPLFLQAPCVGHVLWAYSARHLAELRRFVRARVRRRDFNGKHSMITRLPAWLKAAKNREQVLATIEALERMALVAGMAGDRTG